MSSIVIGAAASHTTLMNTKWDAVDHLPRAHAYRDALGSVRERIRATRPDLVVIVGSNHFRGFWLDLMPAFTIGVNARLASPGLPRRIAMRARFLLAATSSGRCSR